MNEKIKQLWDNSIEEFSKQHQYATIMLPEPLREKFAELIVCECADICMEMAAKCAGLPGDGALAKDCADWIKKDFGVEE